MNWIIFLFALELGWLPQGDFAMYDVSGYFAKVYPVSYTAYVDLEAEVVVLDAFFIGGAVRTSVWQFDHSGWTFFPHKAVYSFSAGARFGMLEMGFRHYCIHPVIPFFGLVDPRPIWEGSYEEFYLRISNK